MRFCLVSTQKHCGGGEVLIASVARQLKRAGHSVAWITQAKSDVATWLERDDAEVLHRLRNRGQNLRDWMSVRQAIRTWAPDVLIMNDTHAVPLAGSAAWLEKRRPLRLAYKHTVFPLRSRLKYQLLTDKLICVSQAARSTILSGGMPETDVEVIYGGAERPIASPHARAAIRSELGLSDSQPLVVSVGNLLECKGHQDLVNAVAKLKSRDFYTVIAGEGGERSRLTAQIKTLGIEDRLRLLGFRADANNLLAAADLVVHPSHAEGLSLVLIQAQMLRKPIVATAVGGTVEVLDALRPSECSSWIAEHADPGDLATQIDDALAHIQDSQSGNSLERRLEHTAQRAMRLFSIEKNSLQLADLAANLLGTRKAAA